jgi:hypothetical protein
MRIDVIAEMHPPTMFLNTSSRLFTRRRVFRTAAIALFASLFLSSNAFAELHSWTGASYSKAHVVKPGKILEVCGDIAAKQSVVWQFTSNGELDFNIHRHEGADGKQVIYDTEASRIRERAGKLAQERAHEWCWMWTNPTTTHVRLSVELKR